ncbi:hypothetical protein CgunFtcFv8_009779 [Champsocephalus gunnari]|uniref:UBC core domain-containing protein n=1 Tax=Champsocephalus gunnari TaxID=52237 RepID=A0AAN8C5A6_CHAGU|nr:hypothetical protein CgunFtcFv8_009779 [Champsocephalus gunnari]
MAGLPRRIIKETQRLMAEPVPGITATPDEGNARYFHVIIAGPQDSPLKEAHLNLNYFFQKNILKDKWSPALQIRTVLLSIQALLSAPNPDDPLANDVAEQWKKNESNAIETARSWTRLYAGNTEV